MEEQVTKSLKGQEFLSKDINVECERNLTLGERDADSMAK